MQSNTSEFATAVLGAKDVQDQASDFAKAVVNELFTDPAVREQALVFLAQLISSSGMQALAVDLVRATLTDPATGAQLRKTTDELVRWLLADPGIRAELQGLVLWLLLQPDTQVALVGLVNRSVHTWPGCS